MALAFTQSTLQHISRNLSPASGLWSLAIANEYLAAEHPLRKGLARKLERDHSDHTGESTELYSQIISGSRISELSSAAQDQLRSSTQMDMSLRRRTRLIAALSKRSSRTAPGIRKRHTPLTLVSRYSG